MKVAHVIPYTRTPRGTDYFDYAIPDGMSIERGDTVWIELRSKRIAGLVWNVSQTPHTATLKPVMEHTTQQYWKDPKRLGLLEWFATWYAVSLPTAFKTMQFPLLRHPKKVALPIREQDVSLPPQKDPQSAALLTNERTITLQEYTTRTAACMGHTLIIVPEYRDAEYVAQHIQHPRTIAYTHDPSPSQLHALVDELTHSTTPTVVIGTKKIAFIAIDWKMIILDQEDSRSHKQYDANPRYHVRSILQHLSVPTLYASEAPSMHIARKIEEHTLPLIDTRSAWDTERVTIIDMNEEYKKKNYTWFSDELIEKMSSAKKSFLFFNRTGTYSVAVCRDCSALLPAESIQCTTCKGNNIMLQGKGIEILEKELQIVLPHKKIVRIDRTADVSAYTETEVTAADIILGTEKAFRHVDMEHIDLIGVLSVDHLLLYPHFQANERVWQLLTTLCCAGPPVIIQTHAPQHTVIISSAHNDALGFIQKELSTRKLLALPPYAPYSILLDPRTGTQTIERTFIDIATLDPHILVDRSE